MTAQISISIRNFKKSFGTKVVHRDISFDVFQGECLGLLAGSGAGKSVILRSLIGLEKPDSGSIVIKGQDVTKLTEKELVPIRKQVGYVFQGGALFDSMTVFDNLAYPLREHTGLTSDQIAEKIHSQLADFGLTGNEKLFPANLSGGMQKRLGLARSIIMNPEIVLYDEPTAGLDPYNTRKIQEMIVKLKERQVTSILVTHDMPTALKVCDRLIYIQKGEVVAAGTPSDLEHSNAKLLSSFINGEHH